MKLFIKKLFLHLLAMILFVVLLIFGVRWWLDFYTNHGESVEVPDIVNMNISDAEDILDDLGLSIEVNDSVWVDGVQPGHILKQTPGAGVDVKEGRIVYVKVRKLNRDKKALPDLINNSGYRHAKSELENMGFVVGQPEYREGWKDYVLGIKWNGRELHTGQLVTEGSTLILVVGTGTEEEIWDEDPDLMIDDGEDNNDDDEQLELIMDELLGGNEDE